MDETDTILSSWSSCFVGESAPKPINMKLKILTVALKEEDVSKEL